VVELQLALQALVAASVFIGLRTPFLNPLRKAMG
jgi:hypothetical protein